MRRLRELPWRLYAARLARSQRPILAGPWRSEVGFELLYWLPFLERFRKTYGIPKERLVYIGRGGSAQWCESAGKADLYEFLPMEAVRQISLQAAQQTGSIKQLTAQPWERHVCELAANAMGLKTFHILSPRWMYQHLSPFWRGQATLRWLDGQTLYRERELVPEIPHALRQRLPARYLAMRWYARATFPLREDLVLWARKLTQAIATRLPVVLITTHLHADDHADMNLGAIPNVLSLKDLHPQTPTDSLAIQSAVLAKAEGFVGTYGGLAQGAMRWGVPTLSFYSAFGQTSPQHLHLSQSLSLRSGVPFIATTPQSIDQLMPLIPLQKTEATYA